MKNNELTFSSKITTYKADKEETYFKDETSKYIFFLVELSGKAQLDFLGINPGHYCNKKIAERWYSEIKKKIDIKHPKHDEALEELKKLYKRMK